MDGKIHLMEINKLDIIPGIGEKTKLFNTFNQFENVLVELKRKELPKEIIVSINNSIDAINSFTGTDKDFIKKIRKTQSSIIKLIEKKLKIVPKNHYRNTWLVVGMAGFGLPIGLAIGASLGNNGLLGLGLPIGMIIGMVVGTSMDKKAFKEGRQLDLEIKHY